MTIGRAIAAAVVATTAVILASALTAAAGQRDPAAMAVVMASRSLQPGELIVFTISPIGEASGIEVTLFGRRAEAFRLADGRWRALVGIDLDQKPGPYEAVIVERRAADSVRTTRPVAVKPRTFPTRVLTVSPDFVNPPP